MSTKERLMRAILPLGKTEAERAAKVGVTVRTLDYWATGKGLRQIERLEKAGVIRIMDADSAAESVAA